MRCVPGTARRRVTGPHPGGRVPSGRLAYTSFSVGDVDGLTALAGSLHRYEPEAWLFAVDDCSTRNVRELEVDPRFQLMRRWTPSGYPTGLTGLLLAAFKKAVQRFEFDVLLKIDTDALCLRPGVFAAAEESFASDPGLGMAGSYLPGVTHESEGHRYAWLVPIIEEEASRDRVLGEALRDAKANGYTDGEHVQGGVYVISREALLALMERGYLDWRPRRGVLLYDDMIVSIFVRAAGFRLATLGDGGTINSAPNSLALPLAEIGDLRPAAVHTVRRGFDGEDEASVRAYLTSLHA